MYYEILEFPLFVLAILANITLAVAVLRYAQSEERVRYLFVLYIVSQILWVGMSYVAFHVPIEQALLFTRLTMFFAALNAFCLAWLMSGLVRGDIKLSRSLIILIIIFLFIVMGLTVSPWLFTHVDLTTQSILVVQSGPAMPLFALFIFLCIGWAFYLLYNEYECSEGIKKIQTGYLFIGLLLTFILILVLSFVLPAFMANAVPARFSHLYTIPFVIIVAYAMIRYRLFDLKLVFQNTLARLVSFVVSVLFISGILGGIMVLFSDGSIILSIVIVTAVLLTAVFYNLLYRALCPFFLKIFSPKDFYAKEHLEEMKVWALMTQKPIMQEVYEKIWDELTSYLDLENGIRIYLYDAKEQRYYLVWPKLEYKKIFIHSDTCISYELEKHPNVTLVIDELNYLAEKNDVNKERYEKIIEELKGLKAKVLVPIQMGADIIGLITLGKKRKAKPYTTQDIQFIEDLATASASILLNAMMRTGWEEMKKQNQKTEEKK